MIPAPSTTPVRVAALAASTAHRRGIAARVVRIMPVPYSPLMTSTASTATTAWPTWIPVRLILARSWLHPPEGQSTAADAAALTPTVSTTAARHSQPVPATVRSFVHSACSVVLTRRAGG